MNKRQRNKAFKKTRQRVFARMDAREIIGALGAEFIREQLARPSRIAGLFLILLRPPFRRWRDDQGVVHYAGLVHDELNVACTTNPGLGGFVDAEVVTCVRCQDYESRRLWER